MIILEGKDLCYHSESVRNRLKFPIDYSVYGNFSSSKHDFLLIFSNFIYPCRWVEMLYLKIQFFCNFRLQRALGLKLCPKLVNMGRSFVQSFSSIALRNQKIWNFLCSQAKNSYLPYLFDLF